MRLTLKALALTAALAAFALTSVAATATTPTRNGHGTASSGFSKRHHAARIHAEHVHHAHLVHAAKLRHAAAVIDSFVTVGYRVSVCEEGGDWHFAGTTFDGGIGFALATWAEFKLPRDPYWMHDASPYEQSRALFRLVEHYGIAMPDQSGCTGSY
jgi:hypothetical protein